MDQDQTVENEAPKEEASTNSGSSPYTVIRVIKDHSTGPDLTVTALVQRRLRDDGRMSREFITIKCEVGKRMFFISPVAASDLCTAFAEVLPDAIAEDKRMRAAYEAQKEKNQKEWEERLASGDDRQVDGHSTGKTERDRKKASYKPYDKRKQEKSERDREIRANMQKNSR